MLCFMNEVPLFSRVGRARAAGGGGALVGVQLRRGRRRVVAPPPRPEPAHETERALFRIRAGSAPAKPGLVNCLPILVELV